MRILEKYRVLQHRRIISDVHIEHLLVSLHYILKDLRGHGHHEGVLVDEQKRFLTVCVIHCSFEGPHVWIETELDVEGAREDCVEDGVCHLLSD